MEGKELDPEWNANSKLECELLLGKRTPDLIGSSSAEAMGWLVFLCLADLGLERELLIGSRRAAMNVLSLEDHGASDPSMTPDRIKPGG
jgi:hypothetical protein